MSRISLNVILPSNHPHRRIIMGAFEKVAKSPVGNAYSSGLLGVEVVEMALKAAAFDLVIAQNGAADHDRGQGIAEAMLTAIGIAQDVAEIQSRGSSSG